MIGFLFSLPGKIVTGLVIVGLAYGAGYIGGKKAGRINQLQQTVKAHEDRNEIDESVGGLDALARCIELGGLPDDCTAAMRGMEETPEPE